MCVLWTSMDNEMQSHWTVFLKLILKGCHFIFPTDTGQWNGHFSKCPEDLMHYCIHGECRYIKAQKAPSCRWESSIAERWKYCMMIEEHKETGVVVKWIAKRETKTERAKWKWKQNRWRKGCRIVSLPVIFLHYYGLWMWFILRSRTEQEVAGKIQMKPNEN